jgi:hypothetical protein
MNPTRGLVKMTLLVLAFGAYASDPAGAQTNISSCTTITTTGSYALTANLSAAGTCLVIQADFVDIDLRGFNIKGNGTGAGIRGLGTLTGVSIHDGSISHFRAGIDFCSGGSLEFGRVERVQAIRNNGNGICVSGVGGLINENVASANGHVGIVKRIHGGNVIGNNASLNGTGGFVVEDESLVVNNSANLNFGPGFDIICPTNVLENTAVENLPNLQLFGTTCNSQHNLAP